MVVMMSILLAKKETAIDESSGERFTKFKGH